MTILLNTNPAKGLVTVTASDSTILTATKSLYVGVTGDVAVTMADGTTGTIKSAAVGYHPLSVTQVKSTGTTATNILALY